MSIERGSVRHSIRLDCAADTIWALVGDPARLPEWWDGIQTCEVHGMERTIVTGSGIPMPEKILTIDATLRRFQYRITAPIFEEHLSTIDVHDLGDGTSLVVYSVDSAPAVMSLVIGGGARAALHNLPAVLGVTASAVQPSL